MGVTGRRRPSWDESAGRVSRAFNDWALTERDQRSFLKLGLRFARDTYNRLWEEAGGEPSDPDGPDQVDSFDDKIDGLWPHDYEWMHVAGVLRDAVTGFEVYLTKAREEVLRRHGYEDADPDRAPQWRVLRDFHAALGTTLEDGEVRQVRELRHFLTHHRGELRTEGLRQQFAADHEGIPPIVVELDEDAVLAALDTLAAKVREADVGVYAHSWGGLRPSILPGS